MGIVSLPSFGSDPVTVTAAGLDGKVDPLATEFNGNIENANIKSSAGITYSKLSLTDSVLNVDINSSANIAASKLNLAAVAQTLGMSAANINFAKGTDITSATTTNIGASVGNIIDVTGTTTITAFDSVQAGSVRFVRFTGILTLTHSGTALILPTGANITTAAGDEAIFVSLGSGNWRCANYQRKDGTALVGATASTALSGSVVQTVNSSVVSSTTGTTILPFDNSIPQNTEGDQYLTLAITPTNASNKLLITVNLNASHSNNSATMGLALFQDSTAGALNATMFSAAAGSNQGCSGVLIHYMAAGTTSATTFNVRCGGSLSGTTTFNGASGARIFGGIQASTITIQEIKA